GASYYALASVSFTSVIPAVWVTATCVDTFLTRRLIHGRRRFPDIVDQFDLTAANAGEDTDLGERAETRSGAGHRRAEARNAAVDRWMAVAFAAGIACVVLPLLFPRYAFGLIWGAVFLLIDPLNYLLGRPSLIRQVIGGYLSTTISFAFGGLVCGFFWEFWNYWSIIKWEYNVPFVSQLHLFEMPLPGYLGYLPFGLEVYAATMLVVPTLLAVRLPRRRSAGERDGVGAGFDRQAVQPCEVESVTAP
ncbi:MAG TPA: hypothetical protein VG815_12265, partial [Chloroflexota bacterium]|nr:hypothetical protein [Chloroflexota bacterium]